MKVKFIIASMCATVAFLPVASAQPTPQPPAARSSAAEVQAAVARLRTVVQDPYVTEAALASARAELQKLSERLTEPPPAAGKRADVAAPAADASLEIRKLLAFVDARIGPASEPAPQSIRAARAAGFSIPHFEEGRLTSDLANALRTSQTRLAGHLRTAAPAAQQTEDLLVEMIVAEERLAWQAGWPFTPDEVKDLKTLKDQSSKASTGKGEVEARNEVDRRIGDIYARRRARGEAIINAQLSQEASSVGREAPPPFVIHRPTTRAGQRALEQRLADLVAEDTGLRLQPGGPGLLILSNGTRPFDDIVASALRGDR